jgi:uncharacterized protein
MRLEIALLLLVSAIAVGAQAASFDCKKARTEEEKSVCANADLSKLDEDMAAAYKATLGLMAGDAKRAALFRKDQVDWVKERGRCGDTVQCLKDEYASRIRWLQNPAHQYAGEWTASKAKITFHVQRTDGLLYVALYPDKTKSNEQQDMIFMSISGKFSPAKQNKTGEDQIIIAAPQFSLRNSALKPACPEIRLSFGTAEMMGLEGGDKCPLLKGPEGDFRPKSPLFIYEMKMR